MYNVNVSRLQPIKTKEISLFNCMGPVLDMFLYTVLRLMFFYCIVRGTRANAKRI